jgi:hypothetical protein
MNSSEVFARVLKAVLIVATFAGTYTVLTLMSGR